MYFELEIKIIILNLTLVFLKILNLILVQKKKKMLGVLYPYSGLIRLKLIEV